VGKDFSPLFWLLNQFLGVSEDLLWYGCINGTLSLQWKCTCTEGRVRAAALGLYRSQQLRSG
jgi:hypothetical protein